MALSSLLVEQEPRWLMAAPGLRRRLPAGPRSWLYEPGSLTGRLRQSCGAALAVAVLGQRWRRLLPSERRLLGQPAGHYAFVREVLLHHGGVPLVLARTAIPRRTLAAHHRLARLGGRPLGEVLFGHPGLERWHLEVAATGAACFTAEARARAAIHGQVWGRRSVYALDGRELLVSEWFLPPLLALERPASR